MLHKIFHEDLTDTHTPVFDYCRKLISDGYPPTDRLRTYRHRRNKNILCLKMSIGDGAKLSVSEDARGIRFIPYRKFHRSTLDAFKHKRGETTNAA